MISLDTNVVVYAAGEDSKAERARSLLLKAAAVGSILPLQVVAEFANVCRKKAGMDAGALRSWTTRLTAAFRVAVTRPDHITTAIDLAERYRLAFFDALICAVAASEGATILLTEDMQDGMMVGGLRLINPFVAGNVDLIEEALT